MLTGLRRCSPHSSVPRFDFPTNYCLFLSYLVRPSDASGPGDATRSVWAEGSRPKGNTRAKRTR